MVSVFCGLLCCFICLICFLCVFVRCVSSCFVLVGLVVSNCFFLCLFILCYFRVFSCFVVLYVVCCYVGFHFKLYLSAVTWPP